MDNFKVALLQIIPENSLEVNLSKGLKYCRQAKLMGADLALFPEMWSVGYDISDEPESLYESSITADSDFVESFGALPRELDMAIGITYLERFDPMPRNSLCLFDR